MATATAMQTVVVERDARFGRTATRLIAASILAVLVLTLAMGAADARTVTTTLGQNAFVNACRNGGGTPKRVDTHVVQCTTKDGTVVTCDFNSSPASCTLPFTQSPGDPTLPITGGVLAPVEDAPRGPKTGGVLVATTGTVLTQAETAPDPVVEPGPVGVVTAVEGAVFVQAEPTPSAEVEQVEIGVVVAEDATFVQDDEEQP